MNQRSKSIEILKEFIFYYFEKRDYKRALDYLTEDIKWFGMGEFEKIRSKYEARKYFAEAVRVNPLPYTIKYIDEFFTETCEYSGIVFLNFLMQNLEVSFEARISAVIKKIDDRCEICAIHMSSPLDEEKIKKYLPAKSVDEKIEKVKHELLNSTVLGGMMGGYLEEGFPFYFINDRMLSYLGYSSEEEFIKENDGLISNCIFASDREYVDKATYRQLEMGDEYSVEYRMYKKDGSFIWVHDIGRRMIAENGKEAITSVCYDITATKNAEELLKISEQRFRIALESSDIFVWEYDMVQNSSYQQLKSLDMFNIDRIIENFPYNERVHDFVADESYEKFIELCERLKTGEKVVQDRIFFINKQFKKECHLVKYINMFDEKNKPFKAIGISRNISEELLIETRYNEANKNNESMLNDCFTSLRLNVTKNLVEDVLKISEDMKDILRAKNMTEFFNMAGLRICGNGEKEKYSQFFNREYLLKSFEEGNLNQKFEFLFDFQNGKIEWIEIAIVITESLTGDVIVFSHAKNINEKKMTDLVLQSIITVAFEFILLIDAVTGRFHLFSINHNNEKSGFFKGINYNDEVDDYILKNILNQDQLKYRKESSIKYIKEKLDTMPDGYDDVYEFTDNNKTKYKKAHIYYADRNTNQICIWQSDITDIINNENKKNDILSDALNFANEANKAKSLFLTSMSHDIRTPMNAIIGMTEMAKLEIHDEKKVLENLEIITSSANHLLSIINDVLDMSKIESGSLVMVNEPFNHNFELKNIYNIMINIFKAKKQIFIMDNSKCVHSKVIGDKMRMSRVLINLLNNASKFTAENGTIKLEVIELESNNPKLVKFRYIVEDNGVGISKDKLKRVFEPFYRDNTLLEKNIEGVGLGLAIVKSIVESKGGIIKVESEEGKGSRFIVEEAMQMDTSNKEEKEKSKDDETSYLEILNGLKILLVEDHKINQIVAKKLFEKYGSQVDIEENGELGLEKFIKSPENTYDVIFMDIQMPIMNGYEACREIRKNSHPQAKTIPIIAMSANVFSDDISKCLDSGMNAHVAKPIDINVIAKTLFNILKK